MNYRSRLSLLVIVPLFLSFNIFSAEAEEIVILDLSTAILSTEVSKQAYEELQTSKEYKEEFEELQAKMKEIRGIEETVQKEGATMSDEDKLAAQKRLRSLSQDADFLTQKLQQMNTELAQLLQRQQAPKAQKVVTELMRAKGIKILLQRSAVLGVDPLNSALDITVEVVQLLNQKEE